MATWALRLVLPAGASFNGQIVWPMTNIEFPNTLKKYTQSVRIVEHSNNLTKHTGFESKKYRIAASTGTDYDIDLSIMLVGDLPRWACELLRDMAVGANGGGIEIQFYDDWITDYQYRGRWVNAGDFVDNSEALCGASIDILAFEKQAV